MKQYEKIKRINLTILETEELLNKAKIKHENTLKYLEMEIAENKELGNDGIANEHAREYVKENENRVNEFKDHIKYLKNMLHQLK